MRKLHAKSTQRNIARIHRWLNLESAPHGGFIFHVKNTPMTGYKIHSPDTGTMTFCFPHQSPQK